MDDVLRQAVLDRLALLDQLAEEGDANSLLPLARTELQRLAEGWRLLLTVHQPDEDGRCKACPGGFLGRGRRWPCQMWLTAHKHLINDGSGHRERRMAKRNPFSRKAPRAVPPVPPALPNPPQGSTIPPDVLAALVTQAGGPPQQRQGTMPPGVIPPFTGTITPETTPPLTGTLPPGAVLPVRIPQAVTGTLPPGQLAPPVIGAVSVVTADARVAAETPLPRAEVPAEGAAEVTTEIPRIRLTLPSELDPELLEQLSSTLDPERPAPLETTDPGIHRAAVVEREPTLPRIRQRPV
ncbi:MULTISPECIES: hypothetical protein [unclassified Crossiella]|uniref:hypothetical protein n=1 Tax=unclassified Crossiella TaxID=2620835 RepID=UPI001FFE367A|nr:MULTISPECIES: hypothetical protein [unclassified Crossiella]MCK2243966.1 hypothetical protein [Crossiella sp. S99.2]MCK2257176.1 hypothetical protein [Crossiella sp. S99.1]